MIALDPIEQLIQSARELGLDLARGSDIEQREATAVSTGGDIKRKGNER